MKILFVSRSLPFHRLGGMEGVAWDLARALAGRGHQVEVLTTQCARLPANSVQEGVAIRTLPVPSGRYSPGWWRQSARTFRRDYRGKVDLVMGIGAGAFGIARRGDAGRTPLVMQVHGTSYRELVSKLATFQLLSWAKSVRNIHGLANDFAYRRFDSLVAIGPAVEAALTEAPTRWAVGPVPITTISNGIDEDHFRFDADARAAVREGLGLGAETPLVVSASRLHVQKGLAEGLAGFARARVAIPDLHYLIVGDGPDRGRLETMARELGVADAVRFAGATPRERLPDMLSAGDVFLFSSIRQEGLALGPLEASASGLPSVVSNHLGTPGLETILVDPRSPQAVAEGLVEAFRAASADRASRLPTIYSLAYSTGQYEALFQRLIGQVA